MSSLKVLIVDDNPVFLEYQRCILEDIGLEVETTQYPEQTIALIKSFDPDLLILDKMMSINGLIIAERVKERFEMLPVLIMSADASTLDMKKAFALGCISYIRKDIDDAQFLELIQDFCLAGNLAKSFNTFSSTVNKGIDLLTQSLKKKTKDVV